MKEIKNKKELLQRLRNYVLFDEIKNNYTFNRDLELAEKYFTYKELREKKVKKFHIAKKLHLNSSTILMWKRQIPKLIKIANQVPYKKLNKNYKWLNFLNESQWTYKKFIKVPIRVKNYNDIKFILNQLQSLNNEKVNEWSKKFGFINKEQAFGYVIGLMISDADKDKNSRLSSRLRIGLTKKFDWSINIGEALCYCLSILGIEAKRVKDGKPTKKAPNGRYVWRSQLSPFITWLKKGCLGLKSTETTTYFKVKMNWVFKCPKGMLIWMLNGIYDGDGCAYIRGWQITNAARPNQEFFNKILKKFNMKSITRGPKSIIETKESLKLASLLPIFRFATGKLEKTKKMIEMMNTSNDLHNRKNYYEIMNRVFQLHKEGFSPKEIPFKIHGEFEIGIHPRRIYTIIKRGDLFDKE